MRIDLIKYQALGNDYLVLDLPGPLDKVVPLLPLLCDRNHGLGADGLLAFNPPRMSVRIFNPDGSEAQKSGNGLRITAAHAVLEHGAGDQFELRTGDRANPVRVLSRDGAEIFCELDIGRPSFRAVDLPALSASTHRQGALRRCWYLSAIPTAWFSASRSPRLGVWSWDRSSRTTRPFRKGPTSSCSR